MRMNYVQFIMAVAVVLVSGISARAAGSLDVYQVSGELTWVDTKLGALQIEVEPSGEVAEYRISHHETRVTELSDKKFLAVGDLWPGQHVTIDVVRGQEARIVQNITLAPTLASDTRQAYGEVRAIDISAGTLVLTSSARVEGADDVDQFHFVFDPKDIVMMQSPRREPVQLEVKPGDRVKVDFDVRDGKRRLHAITLYPPRAMSTTTTTTTVTTTR